VRRRGVDHFGLAALFPVIEGQEQALRDHIVALSARPRSPFAELESTHFARLVYVGKLPDRENRLVVGDECLLFSAEFEASVAGYLEAMCVEIGQDVEAVFAHCAGCPGTDSPPTFRDWVLEHRIKPGFSLHAHPRAAVRDIRRSLELRERIMAFAVRTRGAGPQEFAREYRKWRARL
jgi:hypothetical protein